MDGAYNMTYRGVYGRWAYQPSPLCIKEGWDIQVGDWVTVTMDFSSLSDKDMPHTLTQDLQVTERPKPKKAVYLPRSWTQIMPERAKFPFTVEPMYKKIKDYSKAGNDRDAAGIGD